MSDSGEGNSENESVKKKRVLLPENSFFLSARQDLNLRPLRPERSALPN